MKLHLVTGATGFVGRHLVNRLLDSGQHVWIIVRPDDCQSAKKRVATLFPDYKQKFGKRLRIVEGDILQQDIGIAPLDTDIIKRHTVTLWHLAANLSFLPSDKQKVYAANYHGTVNVLTYANKYAQEFFYVSTAYVCGDQPSLGENELDNQQHFNNEYERSKHMAEKYVRTNCTLPYLIFRPSIIIGDAHKGKAEGCTFGYYRYLYVFHFLKTQIIRALERQSLTGILLRSAGFRYDPAHDSMSAPRLLLPYPKTATVDLIPVDYVVSSMLTLAQSATRDTGVYLTQAQLPHFGFLFKSALEDLGYRDVTLLPVSSRSFRIILQLLYVFSFSYRKYIRSVMWYTPYITQTNKFSRTIAAAALPVPPLITRQLAKKLNNHARRELLVDLDI